MCVAERKPDGSRSDFIYAGSQRIARADTYVDEIHTSGSTCSSCGNQYAGFQMANACGLEDYVIQNGDRLYFRRYLNNTCGGVLIDFDNGASDSQSATAEDGYSMLWDCRQSTWHYRKVNLSSFAGKEVYNLHLFSWNNSGAMNGSWDQWFGDMVLVSADGTVRPIFNGKQSMSFTNWGTGGMTLVVASTMWSQNMSFFSKPIEPITIREAQSLLEIISRLNRVTVVSPNVYFRGGWPQLCWLDALEFRKLNQVLRDVPGSFDWLLVSDLPRTCLLAMPKGGILMPGQTAAQYRDSAVEALTHLAPFIEERLGLQGMPSLGYELLQTSLELPGIEDQAGPGGGVDLVKDPKLFRENYGLPTSSLDRAVHFWITREESLELFLALDPEAKGDSETLVHNTWPYLSIVASQHEDLLVTPDEVARLVEECNRLRTQNVSQTLKLALDRIVSVCRSALRYKLGIYAPGS